MTGTLPFVSPAAGTVIVTKSLAAKATASGSLAWRPESVSPLRLVVTVSATMAPSAASRIGATTTPSASTSNPTPPADWTLKTGPAWAGIKTARSKPDRLRTFQAMRQD